MAQITASMVKELREKTDAPMMECKKALAEADGDMARAEEILRIKLGNKASKAATRVTAEGLIGLYIAADGKTGAVVEVNCETDFVAKNDDFIAFVNDMAELVAEKNPADVAALSELAFRDGTVETVRAGLIGKIGENMSIRRFQRYETANQLASYVHGGRIGVIAEVNCETDFVARLPEFKEFAHQIAMQIAAMAPRYSTMEDISSDVYEAKKAELLESDDLKKKPENMRDQIVEGQLKKHFAEQVLAEQPFVLDDTKTVGELIKEQVALRGENVRVSQFKRIELGVTE